MGSERVNYITRNITRIGCILDLGIIYEEYYKLIRFLLSVSYYTTNICFVIWLNIGESEFIIFIEILNSSIEID